MLMPALRFFPKSRGLCIDKEPSNDSVAGVRSENRFINLVYVWHRWTGVKLTAGQVTQNITVVLLLPWSVDPICSFVLYYVSLNLLSFLQQERLKTFSLFIFLIISCPIKLNYY